MAGLERPSTAAHCAQCLGHKTWKYRMLCNICKVNAWKLMLHHVAPLPAQAPKSISAILRPLEILTRPLPAHLRAAHLADRDDPELTPQVRAPARSSDLIG